MKKAKTTKKGKKNPRSLVVKRLENVSKDVFRKYYGLITDLVGSSPGIYALYDGTELYYVGKSTELRKRVRAQYGITPAWKKAIVTLRQGDKIELFEHQ